MLGIRKPVFRLHVAGPIGQPGAARPQLPAAATSAIAWLSFAQYVYIAPCSQTSFETLSDGPVIATIAAIAAASGTKDSIHADIDPVLSCAR